MLIKHGPHPEEGCLVVLTLRHLRHIPVGALMQHQPRGGGGGGRPLHKYYMDPNPTCHTDGSGFWIQTLILKKSKTNKNSLIYFIRILQTEKYSQKILKNISYVSKNLVRSRIRICNPALCNTDHS